jgi:hypothetical protein
MEMTAYLPTDKHGDIYYGPRTFREAKEIIDQEHIGSPRRNSARDIARRMSAAGYERIAARIRREYVL